jgi:crotonobetainyl-CoA:carnitine CoA-transferase CaiB-like acyl-CoA transferase
MTSPCEGLKVVEVANWVAGPAACAIFRDMGAEVLKASRPRATRCARSRCEISATTPT